MNRQAASRFKDNLDIFSNESSTVGSNSITNNSVCSSFNRSLSEPEDPFEFVNEMYFKVMKLKEMQRKVQEIHRVFNENCFT
jgi:hypothetical protein